MYNTNGKKIFYVDGIKFHLDEKTGYYGGYVSKGDRKIRLHRYIWEKYNGEIPKGYHIHHKDKNKFNNNIENLEMLTASEHEKLHELLRSENEIIVRKQNLEKYARPKANEWHGSEDGRKWHKKQGFEVAKKLKNIKIEKICKYCGKQFFDNGFNKASFCGNNCKSKWRRKEGLDDVEKICAICGKTFKANKYDKVKTCSKDCGKILSCKTRKSQKNKEIGLLAGCV